MLLNTLYSTDFQLSLSSLGRGKEVHTISGQFSWADLTPETMCTYHIRNVTHGLSSENPYSSWIFALKINFEEMCPNPRALHLCRH